MIGRLPPSASVAQAVEGEKLHAPAASRNVDAITALLCQHAPHEGRALEIASGTGQHVSHFAQHLSGLHWHPTEVDPARLASIDAYRRDHSFHNLAPAAHLDATAPGWAAQLGVFDLIVLINLLHLIPQHAVDVLLHETAKALSPGGAFVLYGPFKRAGTLVSPGDARFDADLRAADPNIGYKEADEIERTLTGEGLVTQRTEMPANNLAFVARKERV